MKRTKQRLVWMLVALLVVPFAPSVMAANSKSNPAVADWAEIARPASELQSLVSHHSTGVEAYVCGYSEDRSVRGDCNALTVSEAPGERWFRFQIPEHSIGNQYNLEVDNRKDPHSVDITVQLCGTDAFDNLTLHCTDGVDLYADEEHTYRITPILSNEYWIKVTAHDEEKEGRTTPSGDLTKVRVTVTREVDANTDRTEPEHLEDGDKLERKVCEYGCTTGDLDPVDVFVFEGFAGDEVEIHFGSRENDLNGHKDMTVRVYFETDFYNTSRVVSVYRLDDYYHYDNFPGEDDEGISKHTHVFAETGLLYLWFTADEDSESEAESYTIEVVNHDTSQRNNNSDRDGDGMADLEEVRCGSSYRDPNDTASDFDGDGSCDDNDLDDDNDGYIDDVDPCPFSSTANDHDGDGCDDTEDNDDDGDGVHDVDDECPTGMLGGDGNDTDGDGCLDNEDSDDDNDAWYDDEELECDTDPLDATSYPSDWDLGYEEYHYLLYGEYIRECDLVDEDDDQDGIDDMDDACHFSVWYSVDLETVTLTVVDEDLDGDGCFNQEDNDDDNDGVLDINDDCPVGLTVGGDFDGDGCKDAEDDDMDNDGHTTTYEVACGTSDRDANDVPVGESFDADLDGVCDAVDNDDDNDGVADTLDQFPNNPNEHTDHDGDGLGDNADLDDDNDGVHDLEDDFPRNSDETLDTDGDGIGNNADTDDDGDGWTDVQESECRLGNALERSVTPLDVDGDFICDDVDTDNDNDGHDDTHERACDSDPLDNRSKPSDLDGDEICDGMDPDKDGDGKDNSVDSCPSTPLSLQQELQGAGDSDNDGCYGTSSNPAEDDDLDNDGVINIRDECQLEHHLDNDVNDDGCNDERVAAEAAAAAAEEAKAKSNAILILLSVVGVILAVPAIILIGLSKMRSGTHININESSDVNLQVDQGNYNRSNRNQ